MAGFASPKGEQAKTDVDRIKKSLQKLRERWQVEDREFNAVNVHAYRHDKLSAEIFKFSLAPTTSSESKTLNLLILEEAILPTIRSAPMNWTRCLRAPVVLPGRLARITVMVFVLAVVVTIAFSALLV